MDFRRPVIASLLTGLGLVILMLLTGALCLLLQYLGDERGAEAARLLAVWGAGGLVLVQIILVNLLALGALREKMNHAA